MCFFNFFFIENVLETFFNFSIGDEDTFTGSMLTRRNYTKKYIINPGLEIFKRKY